MDRLLEDQASGLVLMYSNSHVSTRLWLVLLLHVYDLSNTIGNLCNPFYKLYLLYKWTKFIRLVTSNFLIYLWCVGVRQMKNFVYLLILFFIHQKQGQRYWAIMDTHSPGLDGYIYLLIDKIIMVLENITLLTSSWQN